MFNIGPMELMVLAIVGLIVLGPDRLPGLARDAARMIRTLRDMATGARAQLREELGPEFADVDLRSLNPRTAIQRAVLGDEVDLQKLDPRAAIQRTIMGDEVDLQKLDPRAAIQRTIMGDEPASPSAVPMTKNGSATPAEGATAARFDTDAT